ncbi:MAG: hypothetical protein ACK4L4_03075 [Gemmobacter sp.]
MLRTFDVIWLFDRTTDPPKWRMNACVSWEDGWFLRINTRNSFRPCVAIDKACNPWLDHDSFVECNLLEWDEFEMEEAMRSPRNPVGALHSDFREPVLRELIGLRQVRLADKERLGVLMGR